MVSQSQTMHLLSLCTIYLTDSSLPCFLGVLHVVALITVLCRSVHICSQLENILVISWIWITSCRGNNQFLVIKYATYCRGAGNHCIGNSVFEIIPQYWGGSLNDYDIMLLLVQVQLCVQLWCSACIFCEALLYS